MNLPKMLRTQWATTEGFWSDADTLRLEPQLGSWVEGDRDHTGVLRQTRTAMIVPSAETEWVYRKIEQIVALHNEQHYGFRLSYIQTLQYVEYPEGTGVYAAHQDWGSAVFDPRHPELCRKLSFSIQLTDPAEYEGGDLVIHYGQDFTEDSLKLRAQGMFISWPSWMLHEVKPVTRGTRRVIVGFCMGPDFI